MLIGILKVLFIGEGGVGKTSLLKRYTWNTFDESMKLTVGVDFAAKNVQKDDWTATLQIWDLGGQVRFRDLAVSYFKGARLAIAVFDISSRYTMDRLDEWIINLHKSEPDCPIVIVGNKLDLVSFDEYLKQIVKKILALDEKLLLMSAKTGENVNECFELLIYTLIKQMGRRKEFINSIGKTEKKLKAQFVDLASIDSALGKKKSKPKVTNGVTSLVETTGSELANFNLIQEELKKIEGLKSDVFVNFYENLSEVEELVNYSKNLKIFLVKDSLDSLNEQLITIKDDFELDLDSITNLEKEENEFMKILTEIKDTKEKAQSAVTISNDELYKIYKAENPRKKAIWRGKETKGFIEWRKKYLEI